MDAEPPVDESQHISRAPSLWHSFRFAAEGMWYAVRTQRNLRIHFGAAAIVMTLAVWLHVSRFAWAVLVLLIGLVLAAELINTVVEAVVDLISPDFHPLAKIAKDVAAAAVLTVSVTAVVVGLFLLGPPLWEAMFES